MHSPIRASLMVLHSSDRVSLVDFFGFKVGLDTSLQQQLVLNQVILASVWYVASCSMLHSRMMCELTFGPEIFVELV